MAIVAQVHQVLLKGAWVVSIDLKDAYWHVPIHRPYWKHLEFFIAGQKYQFTALLFDLNIAPLVFTRPTKVVLKILHLEGLNVLVYLNNWLVWAQSPQAYLRAAKIMLKVLQKMGILINWTKSHLTPTYTFQWIGLVCSTKTVSLSFPTTVRARVIFTVKRFLLQPLTTRRNLERVLICPHYRPSLQNSLKEVNLYLRHYAKVGLGLSHLHEYF